MLSQKKKEMQLNILKHRQALLNELLNDNDTELIPKIKLDSKDLKKLNFVDGNDITNKQPIVNAEIKEEEIDEDDIVEVISISSSDWNSDEEMIEDLIREIDPNKYDPSNDEERELASFIRKCLDELTNKRPGNLNFYDSSNQCEESEVSVESISPIHSLKNYSKRNEDAKKKRQARNKRYNSRHKRDKILHNIKEKEGRERLAVLLKELIKHINYTDLKYSPKRKIPSQISILLAAKREIELLKYHEKALIEEKNKWDTKNRNITEVLKKHAQRTYIEKRKNEISEEEEMSIIDLC